MGHKERKQVRHTAVPIAGPLTGGSQCCMSNLRNGYVNCHYFSNFHVDFKKVSGRLLNLRNGPCDVDNICSHVDRLHADRHVDFKK